MKDNTSTYGSVTRCLHWLLVVLITAQFTLVLVFTWLLPEHGGHHHDHAEPVHMSAHQTTVMLHQSVGVLILLFGLLFIAWRLFNPKPSPAASALWQQWLARLVHLLIYAMVVAQPVVGVVMLMSNGQSIPFFGLFSIPRVLSPNETIGSASDWLHWAIGWWVILGVLGVHLLGALYHHFVLRDAVLRRMWSGRRL